MGGPPSGMGGPGNAGGFGAGGPMGMGNIGGLGNVNGMGIDARDTARMNSEALSHASTTGIDHANQNSVLAGTTSAATVTSGALAGLTTGTTLYSNGSAVGTVQQIRMTGRGAVAMVVIKGTNGGYYAVPANKLTYASGTLSTTARLAGINSTTTANAQWRSNSQGPAYASATGIAHANSRSVLYGATATTGMTSSTARARSQGAAHASATGIGHANSHSAIYGAAAGSPTSAISVGMPFFSNGTQIGTVYRVVTANGTIQRVLVQATNGRIYSLAPSSLTAANGSVSTTVTLRGV